MSNFALNFNKPSTGLVTSPPRSFREVQQPFQGATDYAPKTDLGALHHKVDQILSRSQPVTPTYVNGPANYIHHQSPTLRTNYIASPTQYRYEQPRVHYAQPVEYIRAASPVRYGPVIEQRSPVRFPLAHSPLVKQSFAPVRGHGPIQRFSPKRIEHEYCEECDHSFEDDSEYCEECEHEKADNNKNQKRKAYYCGEVENDRDSLILDHIEENVKKTESNKKDESGNTLNAEGPRQRRVSKRQEAAGSRKLSSERPELVEKSPYDQKSREKINADGAKKHLGNEDQLKDFDFNGNKNIAQPAKQQTMKTGK
jgi:hypothetical protein